MYIEPNSGMIIARFPNMRQTFEKWIKLLPSNLVYFISTNI